MDCAVIYSEAALTDLKQITAFIVERAAPGLPMKPGKVELKSAGKLAFGPDGILFVADSTDAKIVALDTGDRTPRKNPPQLDFKGLNLKIAAMLGTTPKQLILDDVVVNPISKNIYISASRGRGLTGGTYFSFGWRHTRPTYRYSRS